MSDRDIDAQIAEKVMGWKRGINNGNPMDDVWIKPDGTNIWQCSKAEVVRRLIDAQ